MDQDARIVMLALWGVISTPFALWKLYNIGTWLLDHVSIHVT